MGHGEHGTTTDIVMAEAFAARLTFEIEQLGLERAFAVSHEPDSAAVRLWMRGTGSNPNEGIAFDVRTTSAERVIEYLREYAGQRRRG
jgi:hypothetical protein